MTLGGDTVGSVTTSRDKPGANASAHLPPGRVGNPEDVAAGSCHAPAMLPGFTKGTSSFSMRIHPNCTNDLDSPGLPGRRPRSRSTPRLPPMTSSSPAADVCLPRSSSSTVAPVAAAAKPNEPSRLGAIFFSSWLTCPSTGKCFVPDHGLSTDGSDRASEGRSVNERDAASWM
jgi:hypothetical protein